MKTIIRIAAAAATIAAMLSCTKEGPALFQGSYSFKTSGNITAAVTVVVTDSEGVSTTETGSPNPDLTTEQGQLGIITSSKDAGEMILTMNVLAGEVYTMSAVAKGSELTLEPFSRKIGLMVGQTPVSVPVTVSGSAHRYDDTVIFALKYDGNGSQSTTLPDGSKVDISIVIQDSDVRCVAKLND